MKNKLILVVEDNPDHLELTVLTLKEQGVTAEIAVARDGAQALDYLFGRGQRGGTRYPKAAVADFAGHEVAQTVGAGCAAQRAQQSAYGSGASGHADLLE